MTQYLLNTMLSVNGKHRITLKILGWTRKLLLKVANPMVRYIYGDKLMVLPFSHDFPFYIKNYPLYSKNLGIVAQLVSEKYRDLKIIDVGANVGDSIVVIRKYTQADILAVEGNDRFLELLHTNSAPYSGITIAPVFVSEKDGHGRLSDYSGSSAYITSAAAGVPLLSMDSLLAAQPAFKDAKLVKIDCDGFDNTIIRACDGLISRSQPLFFFEYDPYFLEKQGEAGIDIFSFFEKRGYDKLVLFDNIGRLVCGLSISRDFEILKQLHSYFNQGSERFLDICAIPSVDEELYERIMAAYS